MSVIARRMIEGLDVVVVDAGPPRVHVVLGDEWAIHTHDVTLPAGTPIHRGAAGDVDGAVAAMCALVPLGPLEREMLREALA